MKRGLFAGRICTAFSVSRTGCLPFPVKSKRLDTDRLSLGGEESGEVKMPVRPRRTCLPSSRRGVKTLVRRCSCASFVPAGAASSLLCRDASPPLLFCSFPTAAGLVAWLRILRVAGSCVSAGALRLIPRATGAPEALACFLAGGEELAVAAGCFLGRPGLRFPGAADTADDEVWSFLGRPRPRLIGAAFSTDCTALTARGANLPLRPFGLGISVSVGVVV